MAAEPSKFRAPARAAALLLIFGDWLSGPAIADQLTLPQAIERNQSIEVVYHFEKPATGHGFLDIEWSDVDGRVVERHRLPLHLAHASAVTFPLDARRAVTMKNRLATHLSMEEVDQSGGTSRRENDETTSFIASPFDHPWTDYQIVMWQPQSQAGYAALKRLGVTAGMVHPWELNSTTVDRLAPLLDNDMRWYLENIATDFYSPYHRWSGDRLKNWKFLEVKQRYWKDPSDPAAFMREPSLSDGELLEKIRDRLVRVVGAQHPYRPLYYNLADESGIADLAAFWDFDFSEPSLTAMRVWLKERYGSLTALNQEWDSEFSRWEQVRPMTTREVMQRPDQNFSAWADFKEWMDVAFARAVESGSKAIHEADPAAVAAIEGGQIPGWGGYDYSRLAGSVDAMEPGDLEIARSFHPGLIMLLALFESGPAEAHRVWRQTLRGIRGLILWDENNEFADASGHIGERGRNAAPYFAELRGGLGALLINSRPHIDPVGVLYSPSSMRVQWLLDRKADGKDWSRRTASTEYQDNAIRAATRNFVGLIRHRGLQHRFVSSEAVRGGELRNCDYRLLMLPHAIALSPTEAKEISDFVERGGVVAAEGEPGIFDEHGKRMAKPLLSEVFADPAARAATGSAFGKGRAAYVDLSDDRARAAGRRITELLETAGVKPRYPLLRAEGGPTGDVETHIFDNGEVTVVTLQRDLPAAPRPADQGPIPGGREDVVLRLARPVHVYDVRAGRPLGLADRVALELGPVDPTVLALSDKPVAPPSVFGPHDAHLGTNAEFLIGSSSHAALDVIHLDVIDPEGSTVAHYSGNLLITGAETTKLLPFAVNDKPGVWTIRAKDLLGGVIATAAVVVEP